MITGKVVQLRAPTMADLERNLKWVNDREVTRFLVMRYPMAQTAEENWLRERASKMGSFNDVFLAIETRDGRHIGNTNFFNVSPENRSAELGIMIGEKDCWSQGYGSDALVTLLRFGFDEMNLNRVELWVYGLNKRAQAAYRKVGFVEEARLRGDRYRDGVYDDAIVMGILREEFHARHGHDGGQS